MCRHSNYRIVLSVLCLACFTGTAVGGNLHYFLLCDTLDPTIGTVDDLANSQAWARSVALNTGLMLQLKTLSGENLTASRAREILEAIQPASDDVIFFHYSGHGGNPGDRTWPIFYLMTSPWDTPDEQQLSFDQVLTTLRPKNARLLVILADTCNSYPGQSGQRRPFTPPNLDAPAAQAFKELFISMRGEVLATGCKPGQFSLGGEGEGGVFFNAFTTAVSDLIGTVSPLTWDAVMAKTAADTAAEALLYEGIQEPLYTINVMSASTPPVTDPPPTEPADNPPTEQILSFETNEPTTEVAPSPSCGSTGTVPLALCTAGLSLLHIRRRRCN